MPFVDKMERDKQAVRALLSDGAFRAEMLRLDQNQAVTLVRSRLAMISADIVVEDAGVTDQGAERTVRVAWWHNAGGRDGTEVVVFSGPRRRA